MSLYGALFAGVSGLAAQSSAMGAISDNITNVNTVGYKGAKVNFQTLVTKQVSLTQYSAGGVQSRPRSSIDAQGLLQATSSSTDMALSGQGMFVVNTQADPAASGSGLFAYTRAGSFKVNKEGYLQNVSGFFVQGWPLTPTDSSASATPTNVDVDGNTYMKAYKNADGTWHYVNQNIINDDEVKPLNLKTIGGTADQTTQVKLGANLPSGDEIYDPTVLNGSGLHQTSTLIYDSLGDTHSFDINWMKTNANTWNIQQKTDIYSLSTDLSDSTAADVTAVFSMADGTTSTSATLHDASVAGQSVAFFDDGTIAFETAADTDNIPLGAPVTISGAAVSGNNGTFLVKAKSNATTALTNNADDDSAKVYANGAQVGTAGNLVITGGNTLTWAGASAALAPGDFIKVTNAEDAANNGYYVVTADDGANGITVARAGTVTVESDKYVSQRGIAPPEGAAAATIYNTSGGGNSVYASQGRLDFTAANRADVEALNGKTISVTIDGTATVFEFTTDGTIAASSDVAIDLTSSSVDTSAEVAALVAKALRSPSNYGGAVNYNTEMLPHITTDAGTVKIVQRTGGEEMGLDVSDLGNSCVQSQTRTWSAGPPPTDSPTGQFTIYAISETDNAIEFNGDGTPQDINLTKLSFDWANGAQSMTKVSTDIDKRISLFLGNTSQADGMTQLGGSYQLAYLSQNGAKFGNFSGVSVSSDGVVTALFDNGVRRPVFQIPVATFTNVNGLESLTGNTWIETAVSGAYTLRTAGEAGSGTVQSASLESSTVDIGEEFTTMIVTQRAYSASAKIITTADEMLDELVRIKR